MKQILMSLKPSYVEKIVSGTKTIELRSRKLNVPDGSKVWLYSTLPRGHVEAVATVECIKYDTPATIWERYSRELAVSHDEFKRYVNGNSFVSAVMLSNVFRIRQPLSLSFIRSKVTSFHPPQFFLHIDPAGELFDLLLQVYEIEVGEMPGKASGSEPSRWRETMSTNNG